MYAALCVAGDAVSLSLCHDRGSRTVHHGTLDRTKNCLTIELRKLVTWSNLGFFL